MDSRKTKYASARTDSALLKALKKNKSSSMTETPVQPSQSNSSLVSVKGKAISSNLQNQISKKRKHGSQAVAEKKEGLKLLLVKKRDLIALTTRKMVLKSVCQKWREFKSRLTTEYILPYRDQLELLESPPADYSYIEKAHWDMFISDHLSIEFIDKDGNYKDPKVKEIVEEISIALGDQRTGLVVDYIMKIVGIDDLKKEVDKRGKDEDVTSRTSQSSPRSTARKGGIFRKQDIDSLFMEVSQIGKLPITCCDDIARTT
ncbi:hypothetical protein AgCh_023131 [Apium graveolens]